MKLSNVKKVAVSYKKFINVKIDSCQSVKKDLFSTDVSIKTCTLMDALSYVLKKIEFQFKL